MAFITLRQANVVISPGGTVKGSPLTNAEVDNNFANINIVIGFREDLITTATDNLVAAVNEVRSDLDNLSSDSISNGTSNVSISTANGPIVISANLIPNIGNVINLGSDTNRFKDLFLSGNTINLGGDTISSVGGFIKINNNDVFTTTGNIASPNIDASSITTGTLSVARGGTGITSFGTGVATFLGNPTSANLAATVTNETGSGSLVFATSPTLVTPALGTPSSANLISAVGLPIDNGTTGTLSVARGGTGATTSTGTGAVVLATSPTLVTPILGTPQSGTLTNTNGLPIVNGTTGTLSVARGGTGATTLTANNVIIGNSTSAVKFVAPGTNGNVLTVVNSVWASLAAPAGGTLIPSGTVMLFAQTAAPTGFTKNTTTGNNHALRIVTGTASSGGSVDFSTAFASQTPSGTVSVSGSVGNTTLSTPQIPSHTHTTGVFPFQPTGNPGAVSSSSETSATPNSTGATGGGGAHNHPFSTSSATFSGNAINLAVKFVDVIRATKD